MPTPVAVGDIVQVLPRYTIENQQAENVWYFACAQADNDMLANLLTVIALCLVNNLLPVLANTITLDEVRGKIVGPAVGGEDVWTPGGTGGTAGAAAGDAEPSYVSALVSIHTTQPGRSGRGRIYFPGIPESDTTASFINLESPLYAGIVATLACIVQNFPKRELGSTAMYAWGIYSKKLGGVTKPPFPVAGFHDVTRTEVKRELATTRSRKIGRGR